MSWLSAIGRKSINHETSEPPRTGTASLLMPRIGVILNQRFEDLIIYQEYIMMDDKSFIINLLHCHPSANKGHQL